MLAAERFICTNITSLHYEFTCSSASHTATTSLTKCVSESNSPAAQQNSEGTAPSAGGAAQRSAKEQSARRKDEAKQAAKKPKENALSQFDLNNYASKKTHLSSDTLTGQEPEN